MVQYLMVPRPHADEIGAVRRADQPSVTHIAVGLWVATLAVLALPSPGIQKHRVREKDLLKAYQVGVTTFGLL